MIADGIVLSNYHYNYATREEMGFSCCSTVVLAIQPQVFQREEKYL